MIAREPPRPERPAEVGRSRGVAVSLRVYLRAAVLHRLHDIGHRATRYMAHEMRTVSCLSVKRCARPHPVPGSASDRMHTLNN